MSRWIEIKSEQVLEIDLAQEVVDELQIQGCRNLKFDQQNHTFTNQQYDDIENNTIAKAMQLYGMKLQEFHLLKVEKNLKNKGYLTNRKQQKDGKVKIVAVQRVYA